MALALALTALPTEAGATEHRPTNAETAPSARNSRFDIGPLPLDKALEAWANQAGLYHVLDVTPQLQARVVLPLKGWFSNDVALRKLLEGTGLTFDYTTPDTVQIRPGAPAESRSPNQPKAQQGPDSAGTAGAGQSTESKPEPLIVIRALSTDKLRTENDIQPFMVLDSSRIARSPGSIEDVLMKHVTMGAPDPASQDGGIQAGHSDVNLRGLGANETLVLVDGRQFASISIAGLQPQMDLTPIPNAAIERVEVLPATASSLFGGGATGGAVNVILKRNCESTLSMEYGSSFAADSNNWRGFGSHCLYLGAERLTQLRVAAGFSQDKVLLLRERDFLLRGRAKVAANNARQLSSDAAPPLGATTNLLLSDGTITSVPPGYESSSGGDPLLANAGAYNLQLANSAQAGGGKNFVIRNAPDTRFYDATLNHQFSHELSAFVDAMSTESVVRRTENIGTYAGIDTLFIPGDAPHNPLHQDLWATVPVVGGDRRLENRRAYRGLTVGFNFTPSPEQEVKFLYTAASSMLDRTQPVAIPADAAVLDGTLDVFNDLNRQPLNLDAFAGERTTPHFKSNADTFTLRGRTPLQVGAWSAVITGSLEHREEKFNGGTEYLQVGSGSPDPSFIYTKQERTIDSAYAEASVPFWRSAHGALFELQVAARLDRYHVSSRQPKVDIQLQDSVGTVFSSFTSTSPMIGLRFSPLDELIFRSSFGLGFVAPTAGQFADAPRDVAAEAFRDARRGNELGQPVRVRSGGNPSLRPERARNASTGFLWRPRWLDGARVAIDYTRVWKLDDITNPAELFFQNPELFELVYPDRVTRAAPAAGDPYPAGPIIAIDGTMTNAARTTLEAVDVTLDYKLPDTRVGSFELWLRGTYQPTLSIRTSPDSPEQNLAGVSGNVLKISGIAGVSYSRRQWEAEWIARYFGSYAAGLAAVTRINQGGRDVSPQTFHDVSVSYRFGPSIEALGTWKVSFSAQNIFNKRPAFDAASVTYASLVADPRMRRYALSASVEF